MEELSIYKVRTSVLQMTAKQWETYAVVYGDNDYHGTATEFLLTVGLPSGSTAIFNTEERKFFDVVYDLYRSKS